MADDIPDGCDCLWAITLHDDGSESGAIHIASRRCQERLMHQRTYTRSAEEVAERQRRREEREAVIRDHGVPADDAETHTYREVV